MYPCPVYLYLTLLAQVDVFVVHIIYKTVAGKNAKILSKYTKKARLAIGNRAACAP